MGKVHCNLSEEEAEALRHRAKRAGLSVSQYLAKLIRSDLDADWPDGYFEQLFGNGGIASIERTPRCGFEKRDRLR